MNWPEWTSVLISLGFYDTVVIFRDFVTKKNLLKWVLSSFQPTSVFHFQSLVVVINALQADTRLQSGSGLVLVDIVPLKGPKGNSNRAQQEVDFHVGRISVDFCLLRRPPYKTADRIRLKTYSMTIHLKIVPESSRVWLGCICTFDLMLEFKGYPPKIADSSFTLSDDCTRRC